MHCPSPSRPNCFPLLFFITGFHHSGTTWLRAEMLRKLGFNNSAINATLREHHPAACNPFPVVKFVYYDFVKGTQKRDALRALRMNATVLSVERSGPETLYSVQKRSNREYRDIVRQGRLLCAARCWWRELQAQAPHQTMLLHHALLVREGGLPRPLLQRLEALRRECGFGPATDGAHAEGTLPGDRDHDARRKAQQLLEANYSDAQASAWRHAPLPLMQRITPFETCACGTATLSATNSSKS